MRLIPLSLLALACAGCATPPVADAPADVFMAAVAAHCGKAYTGRIVANEPKPATPDAFEGKPLVMHVRGCEAPITRIEIPFHVGDDHSRTWILTRTATGLRLKHDHRHEDGSPDAMTMYGGRGMDAGSATRQEFPVDAESVAMFKAGGLAASVDNTWAMELDATRFVYELSRPRSQRNPQGRLFRVEFDLTRPVTPPPPPWGG